MAHAATMNDVTPSVRHPAWAQRANIYEVNLRQFTPEGTLAAFERHLPRLRDMGVDILWLMPIQPIGVKERKGTLGSYYSVSDYLAVNPEFGSLADFKRLVHAVHELGMHLILDWVANHTAWDHRWVGEHPEWYKKNAAGEIHSYEYDNGHEIEYWTDVVGLDYRQPAVWQAMTEALMFWVQECDIDGYRCDVAGLVPTPFWEQARSALDAVKPVFMLAEWAEPELHHRAFDMTYGWYLYDAMASVAKGEADARAIAQAVLKQQETYPKDAYRMLFTTNHDLNAWRASDAELFDSRLKPFAVLAATLPGMPLVYGGQESGLAKRLSFFEKDAIVWGVHGLAEFYRGLLQLKKTVPALWNGEDGGDIEFLPCCSEAIVAFRRRRPDSAITVIVNLSGAEQFVADDGQGQHKRLSPWSFEIESG